MRRWRKGMGSARAGFASKSPPQRLGPDCDCTMHTIQSSTSIRICKQAIGVYVPRGLSFFNDKKVICDDLITSGVAYRPFFWFNKNDVGFDMTDRSIELAHAPPQLRVVWSKQWLHCSHSAKSYTHVYVWHNIGSIECCPSSDPQNMWICHEADSEIKGQQNTIRYHSYCYSLLIFL